MFDEVVHPDLLRPGREFDCQRFYCLYCIYTAEQGHGWTSESAARSHLQSQHGCDKDSVILGHQVLRGDHLMQLVEAYHEANEHLVEDFARRLCCVAGPDDFIEECELAS